MIDVKITQVLTDTPLASTCTVCVATPHQINDLEAVTFRPENENAFQYGKLVVLTLHPDLAGRLAAQGALTKESTEEQRSAGLDQLTREQKAVIDDYNERYIRKFGFPFIICARENKVQSIIDGLRLRYDNTRDQEISKAIDEVKKICRLRIMDIVAKP